MSLCIEACTIWLTFCRHLIMHRLQLKCLNFHFTVCSSGTNWQIVIIGSDNGLTPNWWQSFAINWWIELNWTTVHLNSVPEVILHLSVGPWETDFIVSLIRTMKASFKKMHLNMSCVKCWPVKCQPFYYQLWPRDAMWHQETLSTMVQVMVCYLLAPIIRTNGGLLLIRLEIYFNKILCKIGKFSEKKMHL